MPQTMRSWSYLANGTTIRLEEERCVSCGLCLEACPLGVFSLKQIEGDQAVARTTASDSLLGTSPPPKPAKAATVTRSPGWNAAPARGTARAAP